MEQTTNGSNGRTGEANMDKTTSQLGLPHIDAVAQDVVKLGRVAKTLAAMTPAGQRAALCWLIGYFESINKTDDDSIPIE